MNHIFLACIHDRHTDDKYLAFLNEGKAKEWCYLHMSHFKDSAVENNQYGDWCLYISDDYYAFVEKVEVVP
jgi:hypothetical protein